MTEYSYLGKWSQVGWSIQISPKLTDAQWNEYARRAEEGWDEEALRYDPAKSSMVLEELFPGHTLALVLPECGYRTEFMRQRGKVPLFVQCGAKAPFTDTHLRDVNGNLVALARCEQHKGML